MYYLPTLEEVAESRDAMYMPTFSMPTFRSARRVNRRYGVSRKFSSFADMDNYYDHIRDDEDEKGE